MWYAGSLLFKALHVRSPEPDPVCEERIILVQAQTEAEARVVAEQTGKNAEHEYEVSSPETDVLRWTFVGLQKLHPIEDSTLHSGTELFSRFLKQSLAEQLLKPFAEEYTKES
jgi:hypothetical protein